MKQKKNKIKITPAAILGIIFALLIIGAGFYICIVRGEYAGYPTIGLGLCLITLIVIISRTRS